MYKFRDDKEKEDRVSVLEELMGVLDEDVVGKLKSLKGGEPKGAMMVEIEAGPIEESLEGEEDEYGAEGPSESERAMIRKMYEKYC